MFNTFYKDIDARLIKEIPSAIVGHLFATFSSFTHLQLCLNYQSTRKQILRTRIRTIRIKIGIALVLH
jgi:hypothetical protein